MGNPNTDLDRIKSHIRKSGTAEVAHRTKIARRTLYYLLDGKQPTFRVFRALMQDMSR